MGVITQGWASNYFQTNCRVRTKSRKSVTTRAALSPAIQLPAIISKVLPWSLPAPEPPQEAPPPTSRSKWSLPWPLPLASQPVDQVTQPTISWCGGGIYFFWELGAAQYLIQNYDLSKVQHVGASAGALVAALLCCGVEPKDALKAAHRLASEAGVFERPLGLAGIWGELIRNWLRELLPADAADRCTRTKIKIVVTQSPRLRLRYIDTFEDKEDLIDALMASVHIPFFLDGRPLFTYKGGQYLDGSAWDFITGSNSELLQCQGEACLVDYFLDDQLEYSRLDFIKLSSLLEVEALMESGYQWAMRTDAKGGFSQLETVRRAAPIRFLASLIHQVDNALYGKHILETAKEEEKAEVSA